MAKELPHLDSDLPAELRSQLLDLGAQQLLNETIADDPQFLSRLERNLQILMEKV